jgi:hypothetical protein
MKGLDFKKYYALNDWTCDEKKQHSAGFCNTKQVIFFKTKQKRESWLDETYYLKARKLTRSEAIHIMRRDKRYAYLHGENRQDQRYVWDEYWHEKFYCKENNHVNNLRQATNS